MRRAVKAAPKRPEDGSTKSKSKMDDGRLLDGGERVGRKSFKADAREPVKRARPAAVP